MTQAVHREDGDGVPNCPRRRAYRALRWLLRAALRLVTSTSERPAVEAIVVMIGLFVVLHGIVQQLFLGSAPGFEVVDGEFGLQAQQTVWRSPALAWASSRAALTLRRTRPQTSIS